MVVNPISMLRHGSDHKRAAHKDMKSKHLPAGLSSVVLAHLAAGDPRDHGSACLEDHLERIKTHQLDVTGPDTSSLSFPLSHYFISSSHNTYLAGNQLYGRASVVPYQLALEHACRCVEIDVWDGVDVVGAVEPPIQREADSAIAHDDESVSRLTDKVDRWRVSRVEPRVLHGHTATKEVSFRHVCRAIRDSAFKTSDLPIIASLEIHTSHQQQETMLEIMREEWSDFLLDNFDPNNELSPPPTLDSLRRKILIKVKYSVPKPVKIKPRKNSVSSSDSSSSSSDEDQIETVPKAKIIAPLSSMGVFTRSCHFKSFSQAEAALPGHVFSLSEAKLRTQLQDCPTALLRHNQEHLMRVFPKGARITSSNLDPLPLWRSGVQMAALNWQYINEATMLNYALFNGTPGWVLKPDYLRPKPSRTDPTCTDALNRIGSISLSIKVLAAQGFVAHKPYVKCELHLERPGAGAGTADAHLGHDAVSGGESRRRSRSNSANRVSTNKSLTTRIQRHGTVATDGGIDFHSQELKFTHVKDVMQNLTFVRLKIKNDDHWARDDETVAWACVRWTRLQTGLRTIRLRDMNGRPIEGFLLVEITKEFSVD